MLVQVPCCASDAFWSLSLNLIFAGDGTGGYDPHDQRSIHSSRRSYPPEDLRTSGLLRLYEQVSNSIPCLCPTKNYLTDFEGMSVLFHDSIPSKLRRLGSPVTSELARLSMRGHTRHALVKGKPRHIIHIHDASVEINTANTSPDKQEAIVRGWQAQTLCT
ncbi:hypothetical protein CONLIGDRAFT_260010 [Coniochaeta ligniaria NRRL 30616]|uniref:Uncharacterized protein n=1 Tax=Coniochaeta ligniaria NRRL 30616 TaxID=1408157 RepID=A0A1J7IYE8_9PEZI|nr:hypothetical protein CONLIGDRAFT_260010 [Coniochaeta ligniaria NRRL 30616]